jgi:hypothetical protein
MEIERLLKVTSQFPLASSEDRSEPIETGEKLLCLPPEKACYSDMGA